MPGFRSPKLESTGLLTLLAELEAMIRSPVLALLSGGKFSLSSIGTSLDGETFADPRGGLDRLVGS